MKEPIWEPIPGSKHFTRNGQGKWEQFLPGSYIHVGRLTPDEVEEFSQSACGCPVAQTSILARGRNLK